MNIIKCCLPFIDVKSTAIEVSLEQHSGIYRELCIWYFSFTRLYGKNIVLEYIV